MPGQEMTMGATKRVLVCVLVLLIAAPAFAQKKSNEHWVATWATALVSRPQPAAGRGVGPGGPPAPTAPAQPATAPSGPPAPTAPAPTAPTAPPAGPPGG